MGKLVSLVRELDIPSDKFVVVGSAAFVFNGLLGRTPKDIDIVVTPDVWLHLQARPEVVAGQVSGTRPGSHWQFANGLYVDIKPVAWWTPGETPSEIGDPFKCATMMDGLLVNAPQNDLAFKAFRDEQKGGADAKDKRDIAQIVSRLSAC